MSAGNVGLRGVSIINESDLHNQVVVWILRFYPNAMIVEGLGELGLHPGTAGLAENRHKKHAGFAIETKHPGWC